MKPSKSPWAKSLTLLCLMSWMSWSGCSAPRIISADKVVMPLKAGQQFTAPLDGVFLSEALYQRTRQAVADRVLELKTIK